MNLKYFFLILITFNLEAFSQISKLQTILTFAKNHKKKLITSAAIIPGAILYKKLFNYINHDRLLKQKIINEIPLIFERVLKKAESFKTIKELQAFCENIEIVNNYIQAKNNILHQTEEAKQIDSETYIFFDNDAKSKINAVASSNDTDANTKKIIQKLNFENVKAPCLIKTTKELEKDYMHVVNKYRLEFIKAQGLYTYILNCIYKYISVEYKKFYKKSYYHYIAISHSKLYSMDIFFNDWYEANNKSKYTAFSILELFSMSRAIEGRALHEEVNTYIEKLETVLNDLKTDTNGLLIPSEKTKVD